MRAISSYGQGPAQDVLAPYKRYFPESDPDNDYQTHVKDVLGLTAGTSSTDGAIESVVGTFVVDNLDFATNNNEGDCSGAGTLAYTLHDDHTDRREKIHFCDPSWTLGSAGEVDCASLDPFPSTKMDAFSRIALHEMRHYSSVGPATSLAQQIGDATNADGSPAYDPPRVHGLVDVNQDDNIAVAEINADSYAWMSLDAWISRKCSPNSSGNDYAGYFTQDPPKYR